MRIVLGLHSFVHFAGTETYTLTVADELQRLGHEVVVHPHEAGAIAAVARSRGLTVSLDPDRLPRSCNAVLAQDAGSAYALAERYPNARRLMVAHSEYFPLQSPPQLAGVCDGVIVLNERVASHVRALAAALPIIRMRQPVDLKRFGVRGAVAARPRRALILGNYLRGTEAEGITSACRAAGIEPLLRGALSEVSTTPEEAIADCDLVIGLGRCVVEAMAGRRAAYVYGIAGGDGWVTPETYPALEADGFAGTALPEIVDANRLNRDLRDWTATMGLRNRHLASQHHDASAHAVALIEHLGADRRDDIQPVTQAADELARLVRLEWHSWGRYAELLEENGILRKRTQTAETVLEQERARWEQERARWEWERAAWQALRSTRRFRFVMAIARLLDGARRMCRRR